MRNGFRAAVRSAGDNLARSLRTAGHWRMRALPALGAVAALAVAGIAGYAVLNPAPAATSGVQRQIAQGQRISSRSRGQGSGPTSVGGATTASHKIRGSQITAVGDSVMLASASALQSLLPGIYIDAQVSRQMWAGLDVVRTLAKHHRLRQVVVVGLGTNGTVTSGQIRDLVRMVGPRRTLVLVNTYEARPWERQDNATIAAAARRFPNVVMANWHAAIAHRTYLLWPDEVHPRPPGAKVYARMLDKAIQGTVAAPQTAAVRAVSGLSR